MSKDKHTINDALLNQLLANQKPEDLRLMGSANRR